ncbi:MAG: hypothetical protein JW776_13180 [Candidatus Lokiarchaeota archaeon]|nr:hypothetical protein [Candidatus Lokiarchaeota archaeon]
MQFVKGNRITILKSIFIGFSIIIFSIVVLFLIAMLYYPGGNFVNDEVSNGYSLLYNGMCDMRDGIAINGEPNLISCILLKIATMGICIAMTFFFGTLWIFFQNKTSMKYLSWIASMFGIFFGPLNIMIIFSHSTFELHMLFNILATLSLNIAVVLYTILYFINPQLPNLNRFSFLALSICAVSYCILVGIIAGIGGVFNMITHRLGSNLLYAITMIVFMIQGVSIIFYLKQIGNIITTNRMRNE